MKKIQKTASVLTTVIVIIFASFIYLRHVYYSNLDILFERIVPTDISKGFDFFSGDKNTTKKDVYTRIIDLNLKPGDSFSGHLVAKNHDKLQHNFSLISGKIEAVNDKDRDSSEKKNEVLPTIVFDHDESFTIKGGKIEIIKYTLTVPEDIKNGKYFIGPALSTDMYIKKESTMDISPAYGLSINLEVSENPIYIKYEPLITKEPYEIANSIVITKLRAIIAIMLALISLSFVFKYFKIK